MPFAIGGELFELKKRKQRFTEEETLFYIMQIVIVLGYLHDTNILYRDLKPENVLLGSDGYVMLADFGLAKRLESKVQRTQTFCGTPDYMAPEIISKLFNNETNHGLAVDWWAVGVMTYEMIIGQTPFQHQSHAASFKMIRENEPVFPGEDHPVKLSNECRDFIQKCLDKNPETRLGSSADFKDLLTHPWLKGISLTQIMDKKITPPFVPK